MLKYKIHLFAFEINNEVIIFMFKRSQDYKEK